MRLFKSWKSFSVVGILAPLYMPHFCQNLQCNRCKGSLKILEVPQENICGKHYWKCNFIKPSQA